ncbi:NAD(P)H-binding protein [Nonomuraea sp. NPDC052116]|uniref:SDR family oxidoreductase n=1 Tax=Nonomuraea sp. NPDC052116 TaxID=3155665 RepID=UPI00341C2195
MTTLVTGATGNTGRHVVTELLRRGEPVRALTRDPVAAAEKVPAEVELVAGTHHEPATLDTALDGAGRLHITVTTGLAEVGPELVRRAIAATPSDSATTVDDTVERVIGRPAPTFAQWVAEHAERFKISR